MREAGQISWDDALPTPTLMLPTAEQEKVLHFINNNLTQALHQQADIQKRGEADFDKWLQSQQYKALAVFSFPQKGLIAKFSFDKSGLKNELNAKEMAFTMRQDGKEPEVFVEGKTGKGIKLNGDAWLQLDKIGSSFRKADPFTIGLWVNVPKAFKEGVVFHKSIAERLYNFRGFHLLVRKDGTLEATMAHTAPSNAFTKVSKIKVPKERWIHLTMTYDGSAKAAGMTLYVDGQPLEMATEIDQLTKDILFVPRVVKEQPPLQFGGWWRGFGLKEGLIDDIVVYNRPLTAFEVGILAGKTQWQNIAAKSYTALTLADKQILKSYYFGVEHVASQQQAEAIKSLRNTLADSTENIRELMVMQEMPRPKQAYILERGNYDALGEKVFPNTPERIFAFPKNLPKNRYGLAQWLTHPDHPLTARVAVNRLWQNVFGVGLVKTAEDFGNQGEMPSHPQLLDYLAVTLIKSGWDVKKLMKTLVMTATYQQDSRANREKLALDTENRWLSRGPANRLTAEMIRDNALAASGLLQKNIGGKSIKPYQPEGLWAINNTTYTPDSSEAVYRRSLYVVVKRSVPHPTLGTFDGVSRSFCVIRRQKTNTPLQALVTLNDPAFLEVSKVLGEQMAKEISPKEAIITTYRKLTGKRPSAKEVALLVEFQQKEWEKFKKQPQKTKGWLSAGYYQTNKAIDTALLASNAVVANMILNSDATLTKR
ncbi:MAG: DUF1553 domain-containing protein [Spirosomataceae bacterium]